LSWVPGLRRRRDNQHALFELVAHGLTVVPAATPLGTGCSCDRIGCPAPGMHPLSMAWQVQASADTAQLERWRARQPDGNFVSPTGRTHDVLDVPAEAGVLALASLEASETRTGPVVDCGDRYFFFTAARGRLLAEGSGDAALLDEDEWWPCDLDCHPETLDDHPGLRWHNRGSYVLVPPSRLPSGRHARWVRPPELALPDPLRLLDALTTACEVVASASLRARHGTLPTAATGRRATRVAHGTPQS
jgi:hypothetical protein